MRQNEFVYVGQFGGFWRLTPEQWRAVLVGGATGKGHDLTPYRELRTQPAWAKRTEDARGFYNVRRDIRYFEPLNWDARDYQEQLEKEGLS